MTPLPGTDGGSPRTPYQLGCRSWCYNIKISNSCHEHTHTYTQANQFQSFSSDRRPNVCHCTPPPVLASTVQHDAVVYCQRAALLPIWCPGLLLGNELCKHLFYLIIFSSCCCEKLIHSKYAHIHSRGDLSHTHTHTPLALNVIHHPLQTHRAPCPHGQQNAQFILSPSPFACPFSSRRYLSVSQSQPAKTSLPLKYRMNGRNREKKVSDRRRDDWVRDKIQVIPCLSVLTCSPFSMLHST